MMRSLLMAMDWFSVPSGVVEAGVPEVGVPAVDGQRQQVPAQSGLLTHVLLLLRAA